MYADDLIEKLEAEKTDLHERVAELTARAEFVEAMIDEIRRMNFSGSGRKGPEATPHAAVEAAPKAPKRQRRKPVKAEVSASEAVVRLLAGCKMGLPVGEIISVVSKRYGFRENSLRTTLYNLKKKGAIVQDETGMYNHPENLG